VVAQNLSQPPFTGYPIELERRDELRDTATPFEITYGDFTAPSEIDPRKWVRHDRQGNMGSCQGHAETNLAEYLRGLAQGFAAISAEEQFSRLFAYLESQRFDGLLGRDRGSTIAGGLKVARTVGHLAESLLPYRTPYPGNARSLVTDSMREAAKPFLVRSHAWLKSYDEIFRYLASGVGGVETGTIWNSSFAPVNGVVERVNTRNGGGHAYVYLGYSQRKDASGRNYLWRLNSHADSWSEISPRVIDQLSQHRFTATVGMSDLSTPKPRPVDFTKESVLG
jgi:hypothetical protein